MPPAADPAPVGEEVGPGFESTLEGGPIGLGLVRIPGLRPAVGPPVLTGRRGPSSVGRAAGVRPRRDLATIAPYSV